MRDRQYDDYERELMDDAYWDMKRKNNTLFRIVVYTFVIVFVIVIAMFLKLFFLF